MDSSSRKFLAGRRCFNVDVVPSLVLFGMSPYSGNNYECLESNLSQYGVQLGDFLTANVNGNNSLGNFKKINYPFEVKVENNFAIMKFPSAEVTKSSTGQLVFKTKDFGPVPSVNQSLPIGSYEIEIKPRQTDTHYNMVLCAEAIATSANPVMSKAPAFLNDYEVPRSKLQPINRIKFMTPKSHIYESIEPEIPRVSDPAPIYTNTSSNYLELQNISSSEMTMSELIDNLPLVDLAQSAHAPIPKPRTVLLKPKPILKVKPNAAPKVQVKERKMKAFVNTILNTDGSPWYFLWILDVMDNAVLKSAPFPLSLGHFFEGVFIQQTSGRWECTSYVRHIQPFIKGSTVLGKVEIDTKISDYKPADEEFKYPRATAKFFGTVIDRHWNLSPDCKDGQRVTIQKRKLDQRQEEYVWIITGLAKTK